HFFFFQAEDGIRDGHVTGVQTCALPICTGAFPPLGRSRIPDARRSTQRYDPGRLREAITEISRRSGTFGHARRARVDARRWGSADRKSVVEGKGGGVGGGSNHKKKKDEG